jgi:histidyl-tRNA synthetase
MAQKLQTARGIRDLVDAELETYNRIIEIGSRIASLHNYAEILLPIFEYSSVFLRTLGDASDIVTKETYTFSDRDKRSLTLRPEFTAAMVRSLISNGLTQSMPQRFFTHGPLFRHERPQQGRYRQFHQFNCELFGSNSPLADVEIINLLYLILSECELQNNVQIEINSLGDKESSDKYKKVLYNYLLDNINELSEISKERIEINPLRVLDSKDNNDIEIISRAPSIEQFLSQEALEHFASVCRNLTLLGIKYSINNRLVRGLEYYTHTVFEFTTDRLGAQKAIAAGGRYNGLIESMGGPATPAVGFAVGIDRIHELLQVHKLNKKRPNNICYLIPIGDAAEAHGVNLALELRQKGIKVAFDYGLSTKKRMKIADRDGYPICLIFGDDELESNEFILRNMGISEEKRVHIEELDEFLIPLLSL